MITLSTENYIELGILAVVFLLVVLYIILLVSVSGMRKKYKKFMSGKNGASLEQSVLDRFSEIDDIKKKQDSLNEKLSKITEELAYTYQKMHLVKYDAFQEMGGKLSYSLCMLDEKDNGFIITSIHSSQQGSYSYVKEIIAGNSFVLLSEEESTALKKAILRESE
jgi:hypothetical protein